MDKRKNVKVINGFGKKLYKELLNTGLSYLEIETITGINHSNLYSYVKEESIPTAYNLMILCKFLGVSADYLLDLKGINGSRL